MNAMISKLMLAVMAAVLFSPLCSACDECDKHNTVKASYAAESYSYSDASADEYNTGWAGDNRLRMLGLTQECGCSEQACAEEVDAGWAGDNRLRMLGLTAECGCPTEGCAEEINPNWRGDNRLRMLGLAPMCCRDECCQ